MKLVIILLFATFILSINADDSSNTSPVPLGSGKMFDEIAPYYDTANTIMSLGQHFRWRRHLVDAVLKTIPMTISNEQKACTTGSSDHDSKCQSFQFSIIDLATGTGDVAISLAVQLLSTVDLRDELNIVPVSITGIDPSINMLSIAETKIKQKKLSSLISLKVGDGQNLVDVQSKGYDAITMSFGIRNVPNRQAALKEMFRVLKATRRPDVSNLFIMEFVHPSEGFLAPVSSLFLRYVVPLLGSLTAGGHQDEYKHLANSIQNFPIAADFVKEIEAEGFSNCRAENVFFHIVYLFACEKQ